MDAYENAIRHTATTDSPWYVVPADHKWFTRVVVAAAVVEALASLDLSYPTIAPAQQKELRAAKRALLAERKRHHTKPRPARPEAVTSTRGGRS